MKIAYLIQKEFLQIKRNAFLPKLFIVLPVVMLLVVPYAANQEIKNLGFSVADNDRSTLSQRLINRIDASRYLHLVSVWDNSAGAYGCMEAGDADIVIEIPQNFEADLTRTGTADVSVAANAVNGMKGALGQTYVLQIISDFTTQVRTEAGTVKNAAAGIDIRPRYLFNASLDYKPFMVPGIIAMLLTLLIGFLPAINVVGEKERGTIEQINVTPVGRVTLMLSKQIPYWLIGVFVLLWSMLVARLLYGMSPAGGVMPVVVLSALFVMVMSGLGLTVSNCSSTMRQAALLMFFFLVIFLLMSGLLTPISGMPEWAKALTYVNPLRYYIESMRAVYMKGSSLTDLDMQLWAMTVYAVAAWAAAVMTCRKSE